MQFFLNFFFLFLLLSKAHALPPGFVYLHDFAPDIIEDIRYASNNNFIGHPVPGYETARCILSREAATQLAKAQRVAQQQGYSFKVYDCYRPHTAVRAFYEWSQNSNDTLMKNNFYPREDKKDLFTKGYIALASGHSRGSTVDLTLVKLINAKPTSLSTLSHCYDRSESYRNDESIDTGTRYDCLDVSANLDYADLSENQKTNRLFLQMLMKSHGFRPYEKEWWHFTLDNEPFPNNYFDFLVQ